MKSQGEFKLPIAEGEKTQKVVLYEDILGSGCPVAWGVES